ncbi:MAG TPA: protein kinase [Candidatus Acidoferrales bacterium]|nr:protein kinase [Candidatus Acidoferrales bacterium]
MIGAGTKVGPYEITGAIGAGGMGEVYRAHDPKLGRDVAIKVLPEAFARDAERLARFQREAKVLASLSHPNIATIYGLEDSGSTRALVMELVEGPTLADRIKAGPIPVDEAVRIARQIADALEYAHERGIIHRDLKPANVKVTNDDAVKVLDFGLAKALEGDPSSIDISTSPTISGMATMQGVLLGTAAYMSPEQAKAKSVDRRADIWAFGCVLYEMLTGKQAFTGETVTDTLASIIKEEPDWKLLPSATPMRLRVLLQRCVQKDPKQRLRDIGDARISLDEVLSGATDQGSAAAASVRERLFVAAAISCLLAAIVFAVLYWRRAPEKARVVRSYIKAMPNASFLVLTPQQGGFAISPDGLRLAYVAQNADGKVLLWVRPLDSVEAQALAGTEDASFPFWSPDSHYIGFFASGKLKKIESSGSPPMTLCDAPNPRGGAWNQDGVILFTPNLNVPLYRVSASGGTPIPVTSLDPGKGVTTNRWPQFLPDGRHFIYVAGTPLTPKENPTNAILLGSLDSKEVKLLLHTHASAEYVLGHILFLRQSTLMAQPFDLKRMDLTGEAFPIADPVQEMELTLKSMFSASDYGLLAYLEGTSSASRELVWLDRSGKKVGEVPGADTYMVPRISPDGKRVLYTLVSPWYEVWTYDVALGVKTRLTFGNSSGRASLSPLWSPDGRRIAYMSLHSGKFGFYQKAADGSGNEETLLEENESVKYLTDWSPDGKFLAFQQAPQGINGVWMLPFAGDRKPSPFVAQSQFTAFVSVFSPNGKWLAYCSTESGEQKVYVVPFPGPGGKWQVSPGGGCYPRWRRDGKELFYLSPDNRVMAAEVKTDGSSFGIDAVKPLFETRVYSSIEGGGYDVAADGQRFIICHEPGQPNVVITLVANWPSLLRK